MVHYIRFLRTPQVEAGKKTVDISAVVAITTDLGDAFFAQDVDVVAEVVEANGAAAIFHSQSFTWKATSRALKFTVSCPGKYNTRPARLHVTTKETKSALSLLDVPRLLDIWSDTLVLSDKQRAEPIVERQIVLPNKTRIRMWEETGDSIARHIWYASNLGRGLD